MRTTPKAAVERMAQQQFPSEDLMRGMQCGQEPAWLGDDTKASHSVPAASEGPRVVGRRWLLIVSGAAAVAVAAAVITVPRVTAPPAHAATPPPLTYSAPNGHRSAADVLTELADRARRQPGPPGTGRYHYIRTRDWQLHTARTTDMQILGAQIEESRRQSWFGDDGSARIDELVDGKPADTSGTYGPRWQDIPRLEGNEDNLRAELLRQGSGRTTGDWFDAAGQLWRQQVVTPQLQSALLRVLAQQPGITVAGTTTDRAGREGIAISTDIEQTNPIVPEMQSVLVLDPDSGMLLDYEQIVLQSGSLPVHAPATIGYTVWLDSGYTPDTTTGP